MSIQFSASPKALVNSFVQNRDLIRDLVKRNFIGRYRGSMLGVAWSLFHPLLMLVIYTLVFSVAFKARWGTGDESKIAFGLVLFSGMIVHSLMAECLNSAPTLIISNANLVKKVLFPLEILPWVALISATLHFLVSLGILIFFCLLSGVSLHIGILFVPIVLLPLMLLTLGLTWMLASLGVYLRDLAQGIGMVTTVLLFLSPVFYRLDTLPKQFQALIVLNPLTLPITQLRNVMLWGLPFDWAPWGVSMTIAIAVSYVGFWWFQKSRRGFADVL
jgi:lipopolysaccharide transport system permease protein